MLKLIHYILIFVALLILTSISLFLYFIFKKINYKSLKKGDIAPNFKVHDHNNNIFNLSDYKGKKIVLYFFPKSDTPGCTKESCSLKDSYSAYKEKDINIFGISYDTPETLKAFKEKYNLPFTLLSDSKKVVAKKYGAFQSGINNLYPERITILIDQNGKIIKTFEKVNIETHAQDILKYF